MAKRDKRFYEQLVHDAAEASCNFFAVEGYSSRPRHIKMRQQENKFREKIKDRMINLDDCYRHTGMDYKARFHDSDIPRTVDLLAEMHKEQREDNAQVDSPEDLKRIIKIYEKEMLILLKHYFVKEMLPKDFVDACEVFADLAVKDTLIEGNGIENIDYAQRFLAQLRKEYVKVDHDVEVLSQLKRVEDKLELGKEACVTMQKQVDRQYGVYDLYDLSLRTVMENRDKSKSTGAPEKHAPTEQEFDAIMAQSTKIYQNTLKGLGFDNATPQHSYYTMALCQRAAHVAQAEFMRLPKDHADKAGDEQIKNRNQYIAKRVPELVKEVLEKFPPVTGGGGDFTLQNESENIYTHSASALFNAVKWLDQKRAMAASKGR